MYIVTGAGHHCKTSSFHRCVVACLTDTLCTVYLDNPKAVNGMLLKELDRL